METTNFDIEYRGDTSEISDAVRTKLESRILKLAKGHIDLLSAALSVQPISEGNRHAFEVRVVINKRGGTYTASRQDEVVATAALEALDAVERQVREARERRRDTFKTA